MATKTNALSKVGVFEVVTGINTVGLCYLWYESQKIGEDLTKRLKSLTLIVKTMGENINVINQHLKSHLIHHKTVLDVDHDHREDDSSDDEDDDISKKMLLKKLKQLEDRIIYLESENNPLAR